MHNTSPGFTKNAFTFTPQPLLLANTKSDGSGVISGGTVSMYVLVTADATNGSLVEYVRFLLTATAASTSSTATLARLYLSSVGTGSPTSANTICIAEVALPVTVGDSPTIAQNPIDVPLNLRIPAGWFLHASIHAAPAANTAWVATPVGGDY